MTLKILRTSLILAAIFAVNSILTNVSVASADSDSVEMGESATDVASFTADPTFNEEPMESSPEKLPIELKDTINTGVQAG